MAHGITASDKVAIRGDKGWHKLGIVIDPTDTFDQGWEKSGLTWQTTEEALKLADGRAVDRKAIIRQDTGDILGTVGLDWERYQNTELRDQYLRPMIESGLVTLESCGSLWGGKRVWGLGRVKGGRREVLKGDMVDLFVLAAMGHDGLMGLFLGGTAERVVCNNTLQAALAGGGQLRVRHTKNMRDMVATIRDAIMAAIAEFDRVIEVFRALAQVRYTDAQLKAYLRAVFPPAKKRDVEVEAKDDFSRMIGQAAKIGRDELAVAAERIEANVKNSRAHDRIVEILLHGGEAGAAGQGLEMGEGTAWAAYNATTGYLTHERGRSEDNRMATMVFGGTTGIGAKALDAAKEVFLA